MEYNFNNPYTYQWNNGFLQNVYNRPPAHSTTSQVPQAQPAVPHVPQTLQPLAPQVPQAQSLPALPPPTFPRDILYNGTPRFGGSHFPFGMSVPYSNRHASHGNWNYYNQNALNQFETLPRVPNLSTPIPNSNMSVADNSLNGQSGQHVGATPS